MKQIHIFLITISLLILTLFTFCRSTNNESIDQKVQEQSSPASEKILQSKWDNGFSKKQEGDDIGWFQTKEGIWIDTMRDEKHKFNAYPPHHNGKTYFPNFTLAFPDFKNKEINLQDYLSVHVKELDQTPVGNFNLIRDSKIPYHQNLTDIHLREQDDNYLYGVVEEGHDKQVAIDIRQYGDFLVSQLSTWNAKNVVPIDEILTETIIYSNQGKILYQKAKNGTLGETHISKNKRYVFESWGGMFTEDTRFPFECSVYDIENQRYLWKASSYENCLTAGIIDGSNFAMITNLKKCEFNNPENDIIIFNLDTSESFRYISKKKANASMVRISEEGAIYYDSVDGPKPLDLKIDFIKLDKLP